MAGGAGGLRRELGLRDVYAICTGAMFSSGFFLLPGIAFAQSGAWIVLAYVVSAVIVVPAMFSKAELASSLTKAGGTYYFLDRSMGPMVGTVGGLGTWVAMGLKNTFALVGCGAYATLFFDVDMTIVALVFTLAFVIVNVLGAKETAALQRRLVFALLAILALFLASGFVEVGPDRIIERTRETFASAPAGGFESVATTIALVFISYAGLTKVVSVAEEIHRPERNILLGMSLSLLTAVIIYGLGTYLVVMVVDHATLPTDLTPIASAAESVLGWLPGRLGAGLIFVAALAAFLSTANAGILSASRYLLAMGRDRLISERFATIGRFQTPTLGVVATGLFIVVALLTLDVVSIAKLASAFQLLMFSFVCFAVIVMRESHIESYHPTVKSPLYPWLQVAGGFLPLFLIFELGLLSVLFTLGLIVVSVAWYFAYVRARVERRGAILHWFERLGRERSDTLAHEIWSIMKASDLSDSNPYLNLIQRAQFIDLDREERFDNLAQEVAERLAPTVGLEAAEIANRFRQGVEAGLVPVTGRLALPHFRVPGLEQHEMVVVRALSGVSVHITDSTHPEGDTAVVKTLFFLISPEQDPGGHLRILARLASDVDDERFAERWASQEGPEQLRRMLMGEIMADVAEKMTDERKRGGRLVAAAVPDDFRNLLCVAQPETPASEALDSAARLAKMHGARVTVARTLPHIRSSEKGLVAAALAQLTMQVLDPLREQGVECAGKILTGTPWSSVIREAHNGDHDLVLLSAAAEEASGFDSFTRHLLRKCPQPVWIERPTQFRGYSKVLAAIDAGRDTSDPGLRDQILKLASIISQRTGAELHVVQAWFLPGRELLLSRGASTDQVAYLQEQERARVEARLTSALQSVDLIDPYVHLVEGKPADVVANVADGEKVDLVVLGTVARLGILGHLIGNTAEDVLRKLHCGVVAIKPAGFESPIKP